MKEHIFALIVDDSRIQRSIIKNLMMQISREYHFELTTIDAENGKEAITKLGESEVDLVLLDWNMPMFSGLDFLRKIKTLEKCRNLPVIMVTSEAAQDSIIEALKVGAQDYIVKPVDEAIFRKKLFNLMQTL